MNSDTATRRIQHELNELQRLEEVTRYPIRVELLDDNYSELKGEIAGPPDTPYEGGKFLLEIKVPKTYPFTPPKVRFLTKVWHPNISSVTGAICLDILGNQWAASMTLKTVLLSLQVLMASPEPDDPLDAVVASQLKNHRKIFISTAEHWTSTYADGPRKKEDYTKKIELIMTIGCDMDQALVALSTCNWDIDSSCLFLL